MLCQGPEISGEVAQEMCVTWVLELEGQKASTESCMTENDGVGVVFMSGGCLRWGIRISVCLYLFSDRQRARELPSLLYDTYSCAEPGGSA